MYKCKSIEIRETERIEQEKMKVELEKAELVLKKLPRYKPGIIFWILLGLTPPFIALFLLPKELPFVPLVLFIAYLIELQNNIKPRGKKRRELEENYLFLNSEYEGRFEYDKSAYGNANFMTDEQQSQLLGFDDGLVITYEKGKYKGINYGLSRRHLLVCGNTGSEKTQSYIIPNILYSGEMSLVINDPSGEIYRKTSRWVKDKLGKDVIVFAPFNPEISVSWNPLLHVENISDALRMAGVIVNHEGESKDPFWSNSAIDLLSCVLLILRLMENKAAADSGKTLITFENLFNILPRKRNDISKLVTSLDPEGTLKLKNSWFSGYGQINEKTGSNIMATLKSYLKFFQDDKIDRIVNNNNFSFEVLREKPSVVYVIVPETQTQYAKPYITLFYQQLLKYLSESEGRAVNLLLDEFGNLGHIPDFALHLTTLRKRGVSLSLIVQNEQQIKKTYFTDYETIRSGCTGKLYFKGLDRYLREELSKDMGTFTQRVSSSSNSENRNTGQGITESKSTSISNNLGEGRSMGSTYSSQSRALMLSSEINDLSDDLTLFMTEGKNPALLQRLPFYKHPMAEQVYSYSPLEKEELFFSSETKGDTAMGLFEVSTSEDEEVDPVEINDVEFEDEYEE